jgi:hypothetical protein
VTGLLLQAVAGKGHWYANNTLRFPLLAPELTREIVSVWRRRN